MHGSLEAWLVAPQSWEGWEEEEKEEEEEGGRMIRDEVGFV